MADEHYTEEQANEIEILQSIYPTEFTQHSANNFTIAILVDEEDVRHCTLNLTIEYTPKYPDEPPHFTIDLADSPEAVDKLDAHLSPEDLQALSEQTQTICEESLGMAMVFSMATNLKEIAAQRLVEITKELKRQEDARIQKEIEKEQEKFIGTLVTREVFMEWRARFDKEMAQGARDEKDVASRRPKVEGKLTGRQLFEQNKDLANSDSKFFTDDDVAVDTRSYQSVA
ncbi:rwd domain-containing protein [Coemansia sp. RSA 989]|nr:RWD domain-containing protein [Coemansia mojavensis]KAJ1740539.1 rwd domain-containing protein [Coemansia sp. RSA 1086]KAJ1748856.1 rwd domain-containing protein [Coemansia sp. RSA 1821]KAJ1863070.1 rwd domain-containing protein [Coemansia sp. RSA 989]KAJ1870844.1 rwd domain-containing protein [Coemansia sp. RSA 990]